MPFRLVLFAAPALCLVTAPAPSTVVDVRQDSGRWHPPAPIQALRPHWPKGEPPLPFDVDAAATVEVAPSGVVSGVEVVSIGPSSPGVKERLGAKQRNSVSTLVERTLRSWLFEISHGTTCLRVIITFYGEALLGPRTGKVVHVDALLPIGGSGQVARVLVRAEVDASGRVSAATPLSGPEGLREAAAALARQWQFVELGRPATTTGIVTFVPRNPK